MKHLRRFFSPLSSTLCLKQWAVLISGYCAQTSPFYALCVYTNIEWKRQYFWAVQPSGFCTEMVSVLGMEIPTSSTPSVSFPSTGPRSTDLNPTGQHNSALCSLCKLTLTPAILPGVHQFSLTICKRTTFTSLSYRISYTYGLKKAERC